MFDVVLTSSVLIGFVAFVVGATVIRFVIVFEVTLSIEVPWRMIYLVNTYVSVVALAVIRAISTVTLVSLPVVIVEFVPKLN